MPPRRGGARKKVTPYNQLNPLSQGLLQAGSAVQNTVTAGSKAFLSSPAGRVASSATRAGAKAGYAAADAGAGLMVRGFQALDRLSAQMKKKPGSPSRGGKIRYR